MFVDGYTQGRGTALRARCAPQPCPAGAARAAGRGALRQGHPTSRALCLKGAEHEMRTPGNGAARTTRRSTAVLLRWAALRVGRHSPPAGSLHVKQSQAPGLGRRARNARPASPPQALPAGRSGPPSRAPKDDLCPRRRPFASLPFPSSSPSSRPAALTMNAAEPHRPRRRSPMPVPLRDLAPRRGAARARTASRAARPAPPAPLISCGAAAADRFSLSRPALPEHAWRRGGPGRVRRFHARFPGRRAPASAGRAHLAVGLRKLRAASLLLSALFGQLHKVHRHGPCCYPRVCSRSSPRCSGPHAARGLHRGPTLSQNEQHGYPEYNRSCLSILLLRISTNSPYFLLNWATKTVKGLEYLSVRTG